MARRKQIVKRSSSKRKTGVSSSNSPSTPTRKSPRKNPASSEAGKSKRAHRHRPGTQALREIRRLQKTVNLVIPAAPFIRAVREISFHVAPKVSRWQAEALQALQEALLVKDKYAPEDFLDIYED